MSEERLSRRKFLKRSGLIAAGVGIAACGGLGYAATVQPQIQFPEDQLGGDQMNSQNVLIAYASKAGSTAEAAEKMGGILAQRGRSLGPRARWPAGGNTWRACRT